MNAPKVMFKRRNIETEPLNRKIMVHSAMHYKCEICGKIFQFWLEKGLEDKIQDRINPENHKPVPFCTGCLCGGTAEHFAWGSDIRLDNYRPLKEDENYFENREDENCGVSHIRNDGTTFRYAKLNDAVMAIEKIFQEKQTTLQEKLEEEGTPKLPAFSSDDPYGLADISTTALKAELRRRKCRKARRWND